MSPSTPDSQSGPFGLTSVIIKGCRYAYPKSARKASSTFLTGTISILNLR